MTNEIISESDDDDLYHLKLYGIFIILNHNENTIHIFNLLRKKLIYIYIIQYNIYIK